MVGEGVAVSVGVDVVVSTELDVAVSAGVEMDDADGVDVDVAVSTEVDVDVVVSTEVDVNVVVSTWLDVSDGVGVADDEVVSDGVELELEMTSALEELCDETAEDVGVVGVVDVAIGAELHDSDAVGIAEDEDSDSTGVEIEPDVTSELWEGAALEDALAELDEMIMVEDKAGAPWSQSLTYVLTKLIDVLKLLAVAL
jgi:hypothetical protein